MIAVRFPEACARCRRPATRVQPGRVWRSVCEQCSDAQSLSRPDATAMIGVDVSFASPAPRTSQRAMETVRGFGMVILTALCMVRSIRTKSPLAIDLLVAASLLVTVGLAVATAITRMRRTRESLFILQSTTLLTASMLLIVAAP